MLPKFVFAILFVTLFSLVSADTPANCTFADVIGKWNVYIGPAGQRDTTDCTKKPIISKRITLSFSPPNVVEKDEDGERGNFTIIYNQGFELEVGYRKLFAFFEWQKVNESYSKYWCDRTMFGWVHDILGNDWSCFIAVKQKTVNNYKFALGQFPPNVVRTSSLYTQSLDKHFINNIQFVNDLNAEQSSWKATVYPYLEKMTNKEILRMAGHGAGKIQKPSITKPQLSESDRHAISELPESFDWRNVNGQNYVSPIRNQQACGSCYSFASAAMLEARIRIMSNNSQTPVFSPQEIVSCGIYSQGCEGGFPYLIAGKYAQDFGLVEESCYPYEGKDSTCKPVSPNCTRHYVAHYSYIGGYYGACSEALMRLNLVQSGPIAVGFEVYSDFMQYKSGIYHHVFKVSGGQLNGVGFNPFELTNHAVLIVGYGVDATTKEKYWIVKNSWGTEWGEKGYFKIKRGKDECGIESLAVESRPVTAL